MNRLFILLCLALSFAQCKSRQVNKPGPYRSRLTPQAAPGLDGVSAATVAEAQNDIAQEYQQSARDYLDARGERPAPSEPFKVLDKAASNVAQTPKEQIKEGLADNAARQEVKMQIQKKRESEDQLSDRDIYAITGGSILLTLGIAGTSYFGYRLYKGDTIDSDAPKKIVNEADAKVDPSKADKIDSSKALSDAAPAKTAVAATGSTTAASKATSEAAPTTLRTSSARAIFAVSALAAAFGVYAIISGATLADGTEGSTKDPDLRAARTLLMEWASLEKRLEDLDRSSP